MPVCGRIMPGKPLYFHFSTLYVDYTDDRSMLSTKFSSFGTFLSGTKVPKTIQWRQALLLISAVTRSVSAGTVMSLVCVKMSVMSDPLS